jgi:hypothetical protein
MVEGLQATLLTANNVGGAVRRLLLYYFIALVTRLMFLWAHTRVAYGTPRPEIIFLHPPIPVLPLPPLIHHYHRTLVQVSLVCTNLPSDFHPISGFGRQDRN